MRQQPQTDRPGVAPPHRSGTRSRAGAGGARVVRLLEAEAGFNDFTVYEKGDRVGGTWRENTYPGLTCDVPSHSYTYSFAPNPDWTRHFPGGPEIYAYFEGVAQKYGVTEQIQFNEETVWCGQPHDYSNPNATPAHLASIRANVFARNELCALVAPGVDVVTSTLLDRLLDRHRPVRPDAIDEAATGRLLKPDAAAERDERVQAGILAEAIAPECVIDFTGIRPGEKLHEELWTAGETVGAPALRYINRLSDFLFVASRHANHIAGDGDVLWVPGKNRT